MSTCNIYIPEIYNSTYSTVLPHAFEKERYIVAIYGKKELPLTVPFPIFTSSVMHSRRIKLESMTNYCKQDGAPLLHKYCFQTVWTFVSLLPKLALLIALFHNLEMHEYSYV